MVMEVKKWLLFFRIIFTILINEINNIKFGLNDEDDINSIIESIKIAFNKIDQNFLANNNLANDIG